MLDINVNVDLKHVRYPIIFDNNTCTKCGAHGTLRFVDVFGHKTNQEIYPLDRIQCSKCNAMYGIQWNPGPHGKMIPTPTDFDVSSVFSNMITQGFNKKNCSKGIYK